MPKALIVTAAALLIGTSTAQAQVITRTVLTSEQAGSTEIAQAREAYLAAANSRDAEKIADLYAEDAVLIPGDGIELRGRTEIAKHFAGAFEQSGGTGTAVSIHCVRAESEADYGSETGRFEEVETSAAGAETRVSGVYVIIYTRGPDDRWRVAIEVRSHGNQQPLINW
jgi:uncharacterized protein (TIGR02246 family)